MAVPSTQLQQIQPDRLTKIDQKISDLQFILSKLSNQIDENTNCLVELRNMTVETKQNRKETQELLKIIRSKLDSLDARK